MRILSIANCPAVPHLGSGYVIDGYVGGLRRSGHTVDLLQPEDYEVMSYLRPRANGYRQAVGMLGAVKSAVASTRYDLVQFWGGEAWLATRWLKSQPSRPMVVQHSNGPEPRYSRQMETAGHLRLTRLQRWHTYRMMPHAFRGDAVVVQSKYDLQWLEEMNLPGGGRRMAIEIPLADCLVGRTRPAGESRIVGFCGTWLPKKGINVLVADLTRLLREFQDWHLLLLGTHAGSDVSESFPADVRIRIEVVPMLSDKEALARQYERVDIFVLPSVIESFGVALAEAMACGCAPVATRVGFAATLESGREALLLDEPRSPQLYEAVKRLVLDSDLRRQIAANARQRVQHLRWPHAVASLCEAYERWLA